MIGRESALHSSRLCLPFSPFDLLLLLGLGNRLFFFFFPSLLFQKNTASLCHPEFGNIIHFFVLIRQLRQRDSETALYRARLAIQVEERPPLLLHW